jgi:hypothetical protein
MLFLIFRLSVITFITISRPQKLISTLVCESELPTSSKVNLMYRIRTTADLTLPSAAPCQARERGEGEKDCQRQNLQGARKLDIGITEEFLCTRLYTMTDLVQRCWAVR